MPEDRPKSDSIDDILTVNQIDEILARFNQLQESQGITVPKMKDSPELLQGVKGMVGDLVKGELEIKENAIIAGIRAIREQAEQAVLSSPNKRIKRSGDRTYAILDLEFGDLNKHQIWVDIEGSERGRVSYGEIPKEPNVNSVAIWNYFGTEGFSQVKVTKNPSGTTTASTISEITQRYNSHTGKPENIQGKNLPSFIDAFSKLSANLPQKR